MRSPRENGSRPAIDPLFRSAAAAYGPRVVGVLLTGLLDDGVSGLDAILRCGGTAVVQDPADAEYPDLPRNAVSALPIDHCVPVRRMGALVERLVREPAAEPTPVPEDVVTEARLASRVGSHVRADDRLGDPVPYACPDCGGPLWRMDDERLRRFRCHIGHAFTARALESSQFEQIERAMWAALRALEERRAMLETMAADARKAKQESSAAQLEERAARTRADAGRLRELLLDME